MLYIEDKAFDIGQGSLDQIRISGIIFNQQDLELLGA